MYLNALNLILSFSRWTILTIVSASNTTELIIVNMIFGKLRFLLTAFDGIGGLNGTQNDSRTEYNYSLIRTTFLKTFNFEKSDRITGDVNTTVY